MPCLQSHHNTSSNSRGICCCALEFDAFPCLTPLLPTSLQIPMKIPPHMPPEQAQMLMEFLRSNPDAAKQVYEQAKVMMKSPGLANAFLNMQVGGLLGLAWACVACHASSRAAPSVCLTDALAIGLLANVVLSPVSSSKSYFCRLPPAPDQASKDTGSHTAVQANQHTPPTDQPASSHLSCNDMIPRFRAMPSHPSPALPHPAAHTHARPRALPAEQREPPAQRAVCCAQGRPGAEACL